VNVNIPTLSLRTGQGWGNLESETTMKRPSMQIGLGIALGAGIGAAVAVIIGTGGAWLALGIAIGVAIGAAMSKRETEPALSLAKGSSPTRLERVGSE
jgi:hypothetical protein